MDSRRYFNFYWIISDSRKIETFIERIHWLWIPLQEAKLDIIDTGIVQQVVALINSTPVTPDSRVVVCKAVDVIGWLACGGKQCQDKLVTLGVIECFLSLLECSDKVIVKSTWMALNWVIYCAEGKKIFLEG